ncbi:hypothetical protein [Umezawaea sp. NPDC059074]|uniref:hypothetical protein n=1 Tax=Umezawaea sp. NPDC059074 TaxID=3346716 RepID=UPI0036B6F6E4
MFADSWRWIEPVAGLAKAAALRTPGGALARFWNGFTVDEAVVEVLDAVYRVHAPEVVQVWRSIPERPPTVGLGSEETRTYRWDRVVTVDEWIATVATISDHQRLGPRLEPLLADLRRTIVRLGGTVPVRHHVHLVLTRQD